MRTRLEKPLASTPAGATMVRAVRGRHRTRCCIGAHRAPEDVDALPLRAGTVRIEGALPLVGGCSASTHPAPTPGLAQPYPTTPPLPPPRQRAGNDSGGECGVQLSKRFQMPDVSDLGYWSRNLTAGVADALAAHAANSSSRIGGSRNGRQGNPTLGPDAAAFLQRAAAAATAAQQAPLPGSDMAAAASAAGASAAGAAAVGTSAGAAVAAPNALPNPPFWYSFSHGSVHFVVVSTEHNLSPGSRQHRVSARSR